MIIFVKNPLKFKIKLTIHSMSKLLKLDIALKKKENLP